MFHRHFRRSRAALAGLALCGGVTFAAMAATGGSAYAAPSYTTLNAASTFMAIDVSGASTAPGAPVIQWYDDGGANQHWSVPGAGATGEVVNQNSGMCLTTDGRAGDQLFQWYCGSTNPDQQWYVEEAWTLWGNEVDLYNPGSGLWVDVYGDSYWAGASIDAWYANGGNNQSFYEDGAN